MFGFFKRKDAAAPQAPSQPSPAKPSAAKISSFKDFDYGPEMVVIPAGEFIMGAATFDFEKPAHKVTIAEPFAVGKFPVTCEEWDAAVADYVRDNGKAAFVRVRGAERQGRQPAGGVSWLDARFYTMFLSEKYGKPYRLLSEAEWEYCCRAGTTTEFSFGDTITQQQAHFSSDETVPVGSFPPNAFGLHDMHGNVSEWVEDVYHENYEGAPNDGSAWVEGDLYWRMRTGPPCITRGGSCFGGPPLMTSSIRLRAHMGQCDYDVGFRVARAL